MSCRFLFHLSNLLRTCSEVHSVHIQSISLGVVTYRKVLVVTLPDDENDATFFRIKTKKARKREISLETFIHWKFENVFWGLTSISGGGGQTPALRRLTSLVLPRHLVKHLPLCLSDMANIIHASSVSAKIPQVDSLNCGPQGGHT